MNARALALLLVWPGVAGAQGFAGLAAEAEGFALPDPAHVLTFPEDHGPHPGFRVEWWYLTANLTGPDGTAYGAQWTLFRSALLPAEASGWASPQVWMGHAAVTGPTFHLAAERFARGGIGQAGVTAAPFAASIDDWSLAGAGLDRLRAEAAGDDWSYALDLTATGPLVLHGEAGYSVKSAEGQASHYYSQPFYSVSGVLDLPEGPVPVTGTAWLDREWSSQPLAPDQTGWDWFSIGFDDGARLMGFRLRGGQVFTAATWIDPDGAATAYPDGAFAATPLETAEVAGREIPVRWRIALPDRGVAAEVAALNPGAWMGLTVPYWEGPVTVTGSHEGVGYLEMTGY